MIIQEKIYSLKIFFSPIPKTTPQTSYEASIKAEKCSESNIFKTERPPNNFNIADGNRSWPTGTSTVSNAVSK